MATLINEIQLTKYEEGKIGTPWETQNDGMSVEENTRSGCGPCCSYQVLGALGLLGLSTVTIYEIANNWDIISKQLGLY